MKKILSVLIALSLHAAPLDRLLEKVELPTDLTPAELVLETQRLWTQKDKERWNFDKRYEPLKDQLWPIFQEMGLVDDLKPAKKHYKHALVLGSLLKSAQSRVAYLEQLLEEGIEVDKIVFLTGARPLLDSEKSVTGLQTEAEMMQWVYHHSNLPKQIPVAFIDSPMKLRAGIWRRPQTTDTVKDWLKTNPEPGSALAISNQPYSRCQGAILRYFLPNEFELETVGPANKGSPEVSVILDAVAMELFWKNSKEDPEKAL